MLIQDLGGMQYRVNLKAISTNSVQNIAVVMLQKQNTLRVTGDLPCESHYIHCFPSINGNTEMCSSHEVVESEFTSRDSQDRRQRQKEVKVQEKVMCVDSETEYLAIHPFRDFKSHWGFGVLCSKIQMKSGMCFVIDNMTWCLEFSLTS